MKPINSSIAHIFFELCLGEHQGPMGAMPNNPTLCSILNCLGVQTKKDFYNFLNEIRPYLLEDENSQGIPF